MDQKISSTIEQAEAFLVSAQNELCKPEEDAVPYSICKYAHGAIVNFLSAYLMRNGRDVPESHTVEELLTFCREVNPQLDIWMNMDTANDFYKMAEKTKAMVDPALTSN